MELKRFGQFVYQGVVAAKAQRAGKKSAYFTITLANMGERITFFASKDDFDSVGEGQTVKVSGPVVPKGQYGDPGVIAQRFELVK